MQYFEDVLKPTFMPSEAGTVADFYIPGPGSYAPLAAFESVDPQNLQQAFDGIFHEILCLVQAQVYGAETRSGKQITV